MQDGIYRVGAGERIANWCLPAGRRLEELVSENGRIGRWPVSLGRQERDGLKLVHYNLCDLWLSDSIVGKGNNFVQEVRAKRIISQMRTSGSGHYFSVSA